MADDRKRCRTRITYPGSPLTTAAAAALVGLVSMAARPAFAENDPASATRFLVQNATHAPAAPASTNHVPPTPVGQIGMAPQTRPADRKPHGVAAAASKSTAATPTQHIVVAVYGDRMGQALAGGLEALEGDAATVQPLADDEAGLSRPSFRDWLQAIQDRLSKPDHPAVAVMVIGSNDRQAMQGDTGALKPSSPEWQALYGSRVDAVIKAFNDAHVPLIWVGLPPVRSDDASADYVRINGIVRDHALRNGVTYIDSWGAFTDDAGRYSPTGPDLDGSTVKLRRADGTAFTRAGERKLASFVESDINRLARHPTSDAALANLTIDKARNFDSALDIDVTAQIRREAALSPSAGPGASTASGPRDPAAQRPASAPLGPAAGPVLPLTTAPVTPGGQLAALASPDATPLLVPNDATPRPGRADDFAWPKP